MSSQADASGLEKRVKELEEELDFTHAHYHKLIEQVHTSLQLLTLPAFAVRVLQLLEKP